MDETNAECEEIRNCEIEKIIIANNANNLKINPFSPKG